MTTATTGATAMRARWTGASSSSSSSSSRFRRIRERGVSDSRADAGTRTREEVDAALSNRFIALDPVGYFLIAVDRERMEICASHHANVIGEDGRARDPRTGEVIPCDDAIPGTNGEGIIGGDIGAGGRGVVFDDVARELSRSGISARGGVHDERG